MKNPTPHHIRRAGVLARDASLIVMVSASFLFVFSLQILSVFA